MRAIGIAVLIWLTAAAHAAGGDLARLLRSPGYQGKQLQVFFRFAPTEVRIGRLVEAGDDFVAIEVTAPGSQPSVLIIPFSAIMYVRPMN